MEDLVLQSIAISTILGMVGLLLGRCFRVPSLLFLMILGIFAGPTFLNWIQPDALEGIMMPFIEIAVAIIIFEAGLALPISGLKTDSLAINRMLFLVLPFTGITAMLVAKYVVGLPWVSAALFGPIIVVTGPTVIGPLLRNVALNKRVDKLFRWESVWADCIGVILAGVVLEGVFAPSEVGILPLIFINRLAAGVIIGIVAGFLLGRFVIPWINKMGDPGLPQMVVLASAIGVFFLSNILADSSGVVAAAVAGLVLARHPLSDLESIKHFKEQITRLIVAFLFVLLSAQINLRTVDASWITLIAAAVVIIFVIRPAAVLLALFKTPLTFAERLYVGLMGPRGIIAAAMASYYSFVLAGPSTESTDILLLTFIVIFISGGFASIFGKPLARLLKVSLPEQRTGIIIIGYSEFARQLALQLIKYVPVVVVDSNPDKCKRARRECSWSVCDNGLQGDVYEDLMQKGFRRVLVLTPNAPLNRLIATKAQAHVGADKVYITIGAVEETEKSIKEMSVNILAFSASGFDIALANEMMIRENAKIDIVDMANYPSEVGIETLAFETPDGGIRIAKAESVKSGNAICFIFDKQAPVPP